MEEGAFGRREILGRGVWEEGEGLGVLGGREGAGRGGRERGDKRRGEGEKEREGGKEGRRKEKRGEGGCWEVCLGRCFKRENVIHLCSRMCVHHRVTAGEDHQGRGKGWGPIGGYLNVEPNPETDVGLECQGLHNLVWITHVQHVSSSKAIRGVLGQ